MGRLPRLAQEPEPHLNTFQLLPEPVKATEFIRKLSAQMLGDPNVLGLMEKVVEQDTSCSECMQAVVSSPTLIPFYVSSLLVAAE